MNKKDKVFYYSHLGRLVNEKIEKGGLLYFLYNNPLGKFLRKLLNKRFSAKVYSILQNSFLSKRKILPFIKKYNIDMMQFDRKPKEYKSFNDFFTRRLRAGVREINLDKNVVVCPADSKLFVILNLSEDIDFFVKNKKFNLSSFLQDKQIAREYQDGLLFIFRLVPPDYHRFHFPFDSIPSKPKVINGLYESVNPIAYKSGVQPLTENERQLTVLKAESFGNILVVSVGAMFVGKIVQNFVPGKQYKKGDEMGCFEFGGSTLVLIFKKETINIKKVFIENSKKGFETEVKMGQALN